MEFGYGVVYNANTRSCVEKQIKKKASLDEDSRSAAKSVAGVPCTGCGHERHVVATKSAVSNPHSSSTRCLTHTRARRLTNPYL